MNFCQEDLLSGKLVRLSRHFLRGTYFGNAPDAIGVCLSHAAQRWLEKYDLIELVLVVVLGRSGHRVRGRGRRRGRFSRESFMPQGGTTKRRKSDSPFEGGRRMSLLLPERHLPAPSALSLSRGDFRGELRRLGLLR